MFVVISRKAPNPFPHQRGMLDRDYRVALEPDLYPSHAALVRKIEARPSQWSEVSDQPVEDEPDIQEPKPTDDLMQHQIDAINAARAAAQLPSL